MFLIPKLIKKHTKITPQNDGKITSKNNQNFEMHFKVRMQIPNLNRDRVICENRAPA